MRETVFLNTDREMPLLGLGVYKTADNEAETAITAAVDAGYRLIDTASAYKNEESVGKAIAKCGIPRKELFITSKIWNNAQRLGDVDGAFYRSMERLKLDYLDLYLIHWPVPGCYTGTWLEMAKLLETGRVLSIGVSNFQIHHLEELKKISGIVPAVNQIETHVFQQQKLAREYLKKYNCQIESWGPFAEGRKDMFINPVLTEIGKKYGKTAAQTALRFLMQSDVVIIPKSIHKERMQQNFDLFDFTLTADDMAAIEALDGGESLFFSHYDPKTVEWFMSIL